MMNSFKKKAAQGIGTLIIFIALVLVAAVAAGVLIQTASSLQSKALNVGRQSQEKITSDLSVVQVYANGTSDNLINGGVDTFYVIIRLSSASNPIKISDLLLKLDSQDGSQTLTSSGVGAGSESNFGVRFIINGTNHNDLYLVEGDLVELSFRLTSTENISESEAFSLRLIAKNGAVKPIDISTPAAMVEATTYLYP